MDKQRGKETEKQKKQKIKEAEKRRSRKAGPGGREAGQQGKAEKQRSWESEV